MIDQCFRSFPEKYSSLKISVLKDLHISLSQPFNLQYFQIQPFLIQLRKNCEILLVKEDDDERMKYPHHPPPPRRLKMRLTVVNEWRILFNQEKTMAFVVLRILDTSKSLQRAVQQIDEALERFDFPSYYQPPIFHISIGSFPVNELVLKEYSDCMIDDWQEFEFDPQLENHSQVEQQRKEEEEKSRDEGEKWEENEEEEGEEEEALVEIPRAKVNHPTGRSVLSLLTAYEEPLKGLSLMADTLVATIGNKTHSISSDR